MFRGVDADESTIDLQGNDIVESSAGVCELNPACGRSGVGCCNAGDALQGGDCYDGSCDRPPVA
jgi:hypothetical protein